MRLNQIADKDGSRHHRKRVGRGIGSGLGKTAGRGGKGQTARSGGAKPGFEGGQMPIYRRLPKRGFNKPNAIRYNEINLRQVQAAFDTKKLDPKQPVNLQALVDSGVISRGYAGIRLLGDGELKVKANFEVHHASKGAQAAVEKAGGTIKVLEPPAPAASETQKEAKGKVRKPKASTGGEG
jgi:large subunit ribosomal protein L15